MFARSWLFSERKMDPIPKEVLYLAELYDCDMSNGYLVRRKIIKRVSHISTMPFFALPPLHATQASFNLSLRLQTDYSCLKLRDLGIFSFQRKPTYIPSFGDSLSFEIMPCKNATNI